MKKTMLAMTLVVALSMSMVGTAVASTNMLDPFTQTELDTNWVADREYPSGGVTSVTAHGRDDVAAIGVVGADRSTEGSFRWFEGIKKVGDFGPAVQVDLYVPAEWEDAATSPLHVGFWTNAGAAYPLIVFRNGEAVDAGFYVYDTTTGAYLESGVAVEYGAWNILSMTLDPGNSAVGYAINGEDAGSSFAESDTIGQVFLNHYNDGANDYTAHWHAGVEDIAPADPDPVEPDPVEPDPVDPDPVDPDPVDPTPPAPVDYGTPDFDDVAGNTHAAAIDLLHRYGITTGVNDTSFDPSGDLSRGQMGSFLVRLLTLADPDVARPDSHDAAMQLLVERDIFHGQADGELNSTGTLTRGQAASVLVRLIEQTTDELVIDDAQSYADGGAAHGENIAKLATLGVVSGYGDGTFRPDVELRRDQMASLIVRTIDELIESGKITDIDA